jgi:hypothetical protein
MWLAVVALVLGSSAVLELGRRASAGTLPRNRLVGLRVRAIVEDDESWVIAHRAAGSTLMSTGVVGIGLAITATIIGLTAGEDAAASALVVAAVLIALGVIVSVRVGLRALVDAEAVRPDRRPGPGGAQT